MSVEGVRASLGVILRRVVSWIVALQGILLGVLIIAVLAGTFVGLSVPVAVVATVAAGFIPILASLVALRNPRRAARINLWVAPIGLVLLLLLSWEFGGVLQAVVVFSGALVIPGLFWFFTSRRNWPLPLPSPLLPGRPNLAAIAGSGLLCFLAIVAVVLSFSLPWWPPVGDCGGRPLLNEHGGSNNMDFTATIVFVGPRSFHGLSLWSIAHVEQRFFTLPSSAANLVVLRGFFTPNDKFKRYFVEGRRSQGALTRFLPVIEPVPCGRTINLDDAAVALRVLHDGPPTTGIRMIGRVLIGHSYERESQSRKPAPGVEVQIRGPAGTTVLVTDSDGIYDITGLPPGQYSVELPTKYKYAVDTFDLKAGAVQDDTLWIGAD